MKLNSLFALLAITAAALPAVAGVEQDVDGLIPKLAAPKVQDRYQPQMELQALAAAASRPGAETERAALSKVLAARAADAAVAQPARVWIVRQLEHIGDAEAVPALADLLKGSDAELRECARRALEKNRSAAASDSLRAALKESSDVTMQIGFIHSLGERRDAASAGLIASFLKPGPTAAPAAAALGNIATPEAVKALWTAFDANAAGAADALVSAAQRLAQPGNAAAAAAICERLYQAGTLPQLKAAALVGLAAADPAKAKPLFAAALSAKEPQLQNAALTAAPLIFGTELSHEIARLLPSLPAPAKVLAFRLVDASAETDMVAAAADADPAVRVAAIETLGRIGGSASVPVLVKAAAGSEPGHEAATAALMRVARPGADAAVADAAGRGEAKLRAIAIAVLAGRNQTAALPALVQYAGETDRVVSRAACSALARIGGEAELPGLLALALAGKTEGAGDALQSVAGRVPDKSAAAKVVIGKLQNAQPDAVAPLFDVLAMLGGPEALAAITGRLNDPDAGVKDLAFRAIASWPDFAACKWLLAEAADTNAPLVRNVLGIQGVARLVKSSEQEPGAARVEAAMTAMKLARRDDEKKLLLSALAAVPDPKSAEALQPFLRDAKFKSDAGLAAMTLAESLRKTNRGAGRALARAVQEADISPALNRRAAAAAR